ncbi:DUF4244 domain-containing protein [Kitasatospora sp. NBC_01250]|uniref:DUF4244 domain-containing protein n=1 Tax=Kitasatospora sp. NBC_01250 TaxID=2903571 RepID=UPI002E37A514|nr:DUF4244 domain-containing protein [Kitasatospora sp. NBC_01250]
MVTFIASPSHERSGEGRAATGGLAAVRRLPVPSAVGPTAEVPDEVRSLGRPGRAGPASAPTHRRPRRRVRESVRYALHRFLRLLRRSFVDAGDEGMSTAEYAIGTVAACGFAALLYKVVTSDAVTTALTELVNRALHVV